MLYPLLLLLHKNFRIKFRNYRTTLIQIVAPLFFFFAFFIDGVISPRGEGITERRTTVIEDPVQLLVFHQFPKYPPFGPYYYLHESFDIDINDFYILIGPKENNDILKLTETFSQLTNFVGIKMISSKSDIDYFYDNNKGKFFASIYFDELDRPSQIADYTIYVNGSYIPTISDDTLFCYKGYANGATYIDYLSYQQVMFNSVQYFVDQSLFNIFTNQPPPEINFKEMPQIAVNSNLQSKFLTFFFGFLFNICVGFFLATVLSDVTTEKENNILELFQIIGINNFTYAFHWLFTHIIISTIISFGISGLFFANDTANNSNYWCIFIFVSLFLFSCVTFMYCLSIMLSKANNSIAFGFMSTFIFGLIYLPIISADASAIVRKIFCFLPPIAGIEGYMQLMDKEGLGSGFLFSTLNEGDFTITTLFIIQTVSFFMWFLIFLYFTEVFPSGTSDGKPWYFFFKYFICKRSAVVGKEYPEQYNEHELIPGDMNIKLSIRNLSKIFNSRKTKINALNNVNLDIAEGQVCIILGPNAAGKTTLLKCLSGLYGITEGNASLYEYNVKDNIGQIRQMIGLCSQYDILFDYMTAYEHLYFYSQIKGISTEESITSIDQILELIGLKNESNKYPIQYSGGMKRRLSLGIALIGNPKVVLLDEPTSGVDPQSRRSVWRLIQEMKKDRIIILTTHFMDEADLLGDRIAILDNGEIKCCGSSLYLKNNYNVGYSLSVQVQETTYTKQLVEYLRSTIPQITNVQINNTEINCSLPLSISDKFPNIINNLRANQNKHYMTNYSINVASLEEVFLKVVKSLDDKSPSPLPDKDHDKISQNTIVPETNNTSIEIKMGGEQSDSRQSVNSAITNPDLIRSMMSDVNNKDKSLGRIFRSYFKAKLLMELRDTPNLFFNMILSLLFALIAFVLLKVTTPENTSHVRQLYSLTNNTKYFTGVLSYIGDSTLHPLQQNYLDQFKDTYFDPQYELFTDQTQFDSKIFELQSKAPRPGPQYYAGLMFHDNDINKVTLIFNTSTSLLQPTLLNRHINTLLKMQNPNSKISTSIVSLGKLAGFDIMNFFIGLFLGMSLSARCQGVASLESYVINHNIRSQIQIAGLSLNRYRLITFIYDVVMFYVNIPFLIAFVYIFGAVPLKGIRMLGFVLILLLNPYPNILLQYLFNVFIHNYETMYMVIPVLNYAIGIVPHIIVVVLSMQIDNVSKDFSLWLGRIATIIPPYSIYKALGNMSVMDSKHDKITYKLLFDFDEGIGLSILMLILMSIVLGIILYIFDSIEDQGKLILSSNKNKVVVPEYKGGIEIQNLSKEYISIFGEKIKAVKNLNLGIKPLEFFGLLGPNGAGKTTTMRMLTRELKTTSGSAYLDGVSIYSDKTILFQQIGYCPQFDALYRYLTVYETLHLYSVMRGIPKDQIDSIITYYIDSMNLEKDRYTLCANLSGGNCRILSLIISLLGDSKVLILDEPSTGMDASAKHRLWSLLFNENKSRCILFSTHSMEEASVLSNRIGIMTNGNLRCVGTANDLISKYGNGYNGQVIYKKEYQQQLLDKLHNLYDKFQVLENVGNHLRLFLPKSKELSDMFKDFESMKDQCGIIMYSLTQTTLEQIFLNFATEDIKHESEDTPSTPQNP